MNVNYFPSFLQILSGLVVSIAYCTSVSGGQLKYGDQFFFVTAWYKKKICARKNGCWREISGCDECFIETPFRVLVIVCLLSAAREIFKKV